MRRMPSDSVKAWTGGVACVVIVTSLFRCQQQKVLCCGCRQTKFALIRQPRELINPFIRAEVVTPADRFANSGREGGATAGQGRGSREGWEMAKDARCQVGGGRDSDWHPCCHHLVQWQNYSWRHYRRNEMNPTGVSSIFRSPFRTKIGLAF